MKRLPRMLAAGVAFVFLLALIFGQFGAASAATEPLGGQGQKTIEVKESTLVSHECNLQEWHFVINQIDSIANAPVYIWVNWHISGPIYSMKQVFRSDFAGGIAHYRTSDYIGNEVTNAIAVIYDSWGGEFNLSHGPCFPQSETATPTRTATSTAVNTATKTTVPSKTATETPTRTSTPSNTPTSTSTNTPTATPTEQKLGLASICHQDTNAFAQVYNFNVRDIPVRWEVFDIFGMHGQGDFVAKGGGVWTRFEVAYPGQRLRIFYTINGNSLWDWAEVEQTSRWCQTPTPTETPLPPTPTSTSTVTPTPTSWNCGYVEGYKLDENNRGVPSYPVYLRRDPNGQNRHSTMTDPQYGFYAFHDVEPGRWYVVEGQVPGWEPYPGWPTTVEVNVTCDSAGWYKNVDFKNQHVSTATATPTNTPTNTLTPTPVIRGNAWVECYVYNWGGQATLHIGVMNNSQTRVLVWVTLEGYGSWVQLGWLNPGQYSDSFAIGMYPNVEAGKVLFEARNSDNHVLGTASASYPATSCVVSTATATATVTATIPSQTATKTPTKTATRTQTVVVPTPTNTPTPSGCDCNQEVRKPLYPQYAPFGPGVLQLQSAASETNGLDWTTSYTLTNTNPFWGIAEGSVISGTVFQCDASRVGLTCGRGERDRWITPPKVITSTVWVGIGANSSMVISITVNLVRSCNVMAQVDWDRIKQPNGTLYPQTKDWGVWYVLKRGSIPIGCRPQ